MEHGDPRLCHCIERCWRPGARLLKYPPPPADVGCARRLCPTPKPWWRASPAHPPGPGPSGRACSAVLRRLLRKQHQLKKEPLCVDTCARRCAWPAWTLSWADFWRPTIFLYSQSTPYSSTTAQGIRNCVRPSLAGESRPLLLLRTLPSQPLASRGLCKGGRLGGACLLEASTCVTAEPTIGGLPAVRQRLGASHGARRVRRGGHPPSGWLWVPFPATAPQPLCRPQGSARGISLLCRPQSQPCKGSARRRDEDNPPD